MTVLEIIEQRRQQLRLAAWKIRFVNRLMGSDDPLGRELALNFIANGWLEPGNWSSDGSG